MSIQCPRVLPDGTPVLVIETQSCMQLFIHVGDNQSSVILFYFTVEFYNSQVLLKGCEEKGYVIISTAKASLLTSDHCPVWREQTLRSKSTIVGSVDSVQVCACALSASTCVLCGASRRSEASPPSRCHTNVCCYSTTPPSTRRLLMTQRQQRPATVQRHCHVTTTTSQ